MVGAKEEITKKKSNQHFGNFRISDIVLFFFKRNVREKISILLLYSSINSPIVGSFSLSYLPFILAKADGTGLDL